MTKQSDDVEAIRQLVQDWHGGWQNSDIAALLALFTDEPKESGSIEIKQAFLV